MSGILAILNTDGKTVDPELLQKLTNCMDFRAPDGASVWVENAFGMGHATFSTTVDSQREQQPLSFDGSVWLNAYARIDGRSELLRQLASAGRTLQSQVTDADLILHAYHVWGTACLDHLMGDFAFIIWDQKQQRLFCALDHFGIRPLFYTFAENTLIVGNTLCCVRQHPNVSQELDDRAIADYLLFNRYLEGDMTAYSTIRRLPPAHYLIYQRGEFSVQPYWSIPFEEPLLYRSADEYVEHFGELFNAAVSDRLNSSRIAISLSGGLDSTAVASVAAEKLVSGSDSYTLWALTEAYSRLIPDQEGHYAQMAADHLYIPLQIREVDDYHLFQKWDKLDLASTEPKNQTLIAWNHDRSNQIAAKSRLMLTGFGGDPLFFPEPYYLYSLLGKGQFRHLLFSLNQCRQVGNFPPLYLRTWFRGRFRRGQEKLPFSPLPFWLNENLVQEFGLVERSHEYYYSPRGWHPNRPAAASSLNPIFWSSLLYQFDPAIQPTPIEARHPFLDIRLINFSLRLPPAPWCVGKFLLRSFLKNRLPAQIVNRPKTPLARRPIHEWDHDNWQKTATRLAGVVDDVRRFGDLSAVLEQFNAGVQHEYSFAFGRDLRLLCLANWLDGNQR